jgi:hypothetical protein
MISKYIHVIKSNKLKYIQIMISKYIHVIKSNRLKYIQIMISKYINVIKSNRLKFQASAEVYLRPYLFWLVLRLRFLFI